MARIDDLLNRILSQHRDLLVPTDLIAQFSEALVQQFPQSTSALTRYLQNRSQEDALSLYMALIHLAFMKGDSVDWNAGGLAETILEMSPSVEQAVENELPEQMARSLYGAIDSFHTEAELVSIIRRNPEVLSPSFDAILAGQSIGAFWVFNEPQRAIEFTKWRQILLGYRRQQQSGQEVREFPSSRGRGSQPRQAAQSPMGQGTVLAKHVKFFEDPSNPHPLLLGGEQFNVIAFPDFLYLQDDRTGQELLSIPWGNIRLSKCRSTTRKKSTARRAAADLIGIFTPFGGEYEHEGLEVTYWDTLYNDELKVFFRTFGGDDENNKLRGAIVRYVRDYQRRTGQVGRPH